MFCFMMLFLQIFVSCEKARKVAKEDRAQLVAEATAADDCIVTYVPGPVPPPPRVCHYDSNVVTSCNVTGAWRPEEYDFTWPGQREFLQRACSSFVAPKKVGQV
jgi:hypothetical protein